MQTPTIEQAVAKLTTAIEEFKQWHDKRVTQPDIELDIDRVAVMSLVGGDDWDKVKEILTHCAADLKPVCKRNRVSMYFAPSAETGWVMSFQLDSRHREGRPNRYPIALGWDKAIPQGSIAATLDALAVQLRPPMTDHELGKEIATLVYPQLKKIANWYNDLPREKLVDWLDLSGEVWDAIVAPAAVIYPSITGAQWMRAEHELNWMLVVDKMKIDISTSGRKMRLSKIHLGSSYCFNTLAAMAAKQLEI